MTSPIGGSRPSPSLGAFGSKPDVKKEPTSATTNLAPAPAPADSESYTSRPKQPAVAGVGGGAQLVSSSNGRGSSARVPEAPLTPAQSTLREGFEGLPEETLVNILPNTLPAIENLAANRVLGAANRVLGFKLPFSKKDGCVTPDELKRGRATLRAHLSDLSPKGLEALKKLDNTWKVALNANDKKNPDKIRDYFMRMEDVARRMEENAPELAKLDGNKNYISLSDMYHLQKLLGTL